MPDHLDFVFCTQLGGGPPIDVRCCPEDFWSVAQQRAMERLYPRQTCEEFGVLDIRKRNLPIIVPHPSELADHPGISTYQAPAPDPESPDTGLHNSRYAARARRIARSYACLFLEHFEHGNPDLLGRFYWAGLAAFASKQVAVTLELMPVHLMARDTVIALGKGNLWLYNDAWPWHFAWALCPDSVRMYMDKRHAQTFDPRVQDNLLAQEWAEELLPQIPRHINDQTGELGEAIGYLQVAPLLRTAINIWDRLQKESSPTKQQDLALEHLMAMARHEQGEVLQGLIYMDPAFQRDLDFARDMRQRPPFSYVTSLKLQLSFSTTGYVDDPQFRSDAPLDLRLQNYCERMFWIQDAADQYHGLMTGAHRQRMIDALRSMALQDG